jgi:hypothetical protein
MMLNRLRNWRTVIALGLLAIGAAFVLGAGRSVQPVIHVPGEGERIVPRIQIIQFDDTVARFDTSTGEIHRFHGDLDKPNVRGQWVSHVRGVSGNTSGLLQIQKPRGVRGEEAIFLVDVITGDTWLLRRRGASADWDKIDVAR